MSVSAAAFRHSVKVCPLSFHSVFRIFVSYAGNGRRKVPARLSQLALSVNLLSIQACAAASVSRALDSILLLRQAGTVP